MNDKEQSNSPTSRSSCDGVFKSLGCDLLQGLSHNINTLQKQQVDKDDDENGIVDGSERNLKEFKSFTQQKLYMELSGFEKVEKILDPIFNDFGYYYKRQEIGITELDFKVKTQDYEIVPYENFEYHVKNINLQSQQPRVMVLVRIYGEIFIGFVYEYDTSPSTEEDQDEEFENVKTSNKRNRKLSIIKNSKKMKTTSRTKHFDIEYSNNLQFLTQRFDFTKATCSKIKSQDKIALYFKLSNGFLKIVHYFDNSFENEKGMEMVKNIHHDNITKIERFEKKLLTSSQFNELFMEDVSNMDNSLVFMTFSELIQSLVAFSINVSRKPQVTKELICSKLFLDAIDAVNTLHANNIIHGDISIANLGFKFSENSLTSYVFEKNEIMKHCKDFSTFNLILLDLNHCKVEGQLQIKSNDDCNKSNEDYFYPYTTDMYCPTNSSLEFTKEHDIYSLSLVLAQLYFILVGGMSIDDVVKWGRDQLMEELVRSKNEIVKLLRRAIENEGCGDFEWLDFKKIFSLFSLLHEKK